MTRTYTLTHVARPWTMNQDRGRSNRFRLAERTKEWRDVFHLLAVEQNIPALHAATRRIVDTVVAGRRPVVRETITGGIIHAWRAAPNLSDPMVRPDWHDRAACGRNGIIGDDPRARTALMFSTDRALVAEALAVCAECPVKDRCRDMRPSSAMRDRLGIWAGIAPPITRQVGRPTGSGTLQAATVRDIRERHQFGDPQWEIAKDYGLSAATVSNIVNRVSYRWVP